uniref:MYND-type domain-containing protein n=1 Tax=Stomoxys calcitrans TaxID=35570 RepID=A0A1I8NRZ6_STOCA
MEMHDIESGQIDMAENARKAHPDCLRYFLMHLRFPGASNVVEDGREDSCHVDQLVETLIKMGGYAATTAKEAIVLALGDGLLMPVSSVCTSPRPRAALPESKRVRLPNSHEVRVNTSHDWYCYECHLPGQLEHCGQCWRSFHRVCFRKNPERPNYAVPSSKKQKNRLPAFSSDTDSETDADTAARCSTAMDSDHETRENSSQVQVCQPRSRNSIHEVADNDDNPCSPQINQPEPKPLIDEDIESKSKVDVVCLGEVRPPNRKRPNTTASNISYKSENVTLGDEDDVDIELCTSCRLLKRANLHNPPNLQSDELSHLINYTFSYNREWLTHDVREYLTAQRFNVKEINLINHLLLYSPIKRLTDIASKMQRNEYKFLTEFLVDLLDIQHNIGVFFGPYSTEMESTKWLLRDVAHDLSEIRRCPDCFRYSHEKDSVIWFAKPCVQRHELVYAKHSGFPYWPAKVIRVLANNKFDVRFFGGTHSRALIDVRFIKPIDSDVKSLKLGNSPTIKKAMEELRYHQMLSTYPPSKFSFHANLQETEEIIRTVISSNPNTTILKDRRSRNGKRRKSAVISIEDDMFLGGNTTSQDSTAGSSHSTRRVVGQQNIVCPELKVSVKRLKPHQIPSSFYESSNNSISEKRTTRKSTKNTSGKDQSQGWKKMLKEIEEARKIINEYKVKNEKLQSQKQKLRETIKKQELERKIMKRKQWCYWCLSEAIYLCCFRAAYCSQICQSRHWKEGHSKECKNPNNGSNKKS